MTTTTLTSKGQITLTRSIRERLDLKQGDRLHMSISSDGILTIRREEQPSLSSAYGMFARLGRRKSVSLGDMRTAIQTRAKRKHLGSRA